MKILSVLFLSLIVVQAANAAGNSKCWIVCDTPDYYEVLLSKEYVPITTGAATANGYLPGLSFMFLNDFRGVIRDQTGLTLFSATPLNRGYGNSAMVINVLDQIPKCSELRK